MLINARGQDSTCRVSIGEQLFAATLRETIFILSF